MWAPQSWPGADTSTTGSPWVSRESRRGAVSRSRAWVRRWPWSSGIRNRPREGAVAVVVQGQERLGLRGAGLAAEQDRLVPVGQVDVDGGEHPPRRLPQPLGVQAASGPGAGPVALATSHSSAARPGPRWLRPVPARRRPRSPAPARPAAARPRTPPGSPGICPASSRAIRNPPATCSRVDPVNRANHASVPVSAVASATRRRSASADNTSRSAAARDSTRANPATASPSASSPSDSTATPPARVKHASTSVISSRTPCSATGGSGVRSSTATLIPVWYRTRVRSTTPSAPRCGDPNPTTDPAHQSTHMPMSVRPSMAAQVGVMDG